VTEDCRSHSYRAEIRTSGLHRATGVRRRLALSVPAVAGVRGVGALLLTLFVIGWLAAAAAPAAQARRDHAIKLTIVETKSRPRTRTPPGLPLSGRSPCAPGSPR